MKQYYSYHAVDEAYEDYDTANIEDYYDRSHVYLDRYRDDLPLPVVCFEIKSDYLARYLVLQTTGTDMEFRRLGYGYSRVSSGSLGSYIFNGVEKSTIKIV